MIDRPDSLLPLLVIEKAADWRLLKSKIPHPLLDDAGLRRLRTTLGRSAQSVVVERHYLDKDFRDTFSAFHSRRFSSPLPRCDRLHFFHRRLTRSDLTNRELLQASYIGYSIIRPTRPNVVGRTMFDPDKLAHTKGWVRRCPETISLQGVELKVEGFPFISQDADVTVCAQSALWMLLRYFSNRYQHYREIYPSQVGLLSKDFSFGRLFPSRGLTDWQMAESLRQYGFAPLIYSRHHHGEAKLLHLLHTHVDSGVPVLLSFDDHVITCFGHGTRSPRGLKPPFADPDEPWVSVASFNDCLIVNDDNHIPYQRLWRSGPAALRKPQRFDSALSFDQIQSFIVPLPERVHLAAEDFVVLCNQLLFGPKSAYAWRRHGGTRAGERLLLRHFLTTGRAFKRHIAGREGMGHPDVAEIYRALPLPHYLWVCEISTESSYLPSLPAPADTLQHPRIIGEIVWDATRNAHEPNGWLVLRYPDVLIADGGSAQNGEPRLDIFRLSDSRDYPAFSNNLHPVRQQSW